MASHGALGTAPGTALRARASDSSRSWCSRYDLRSAGAALGAGGFSLCAFAVGARGTSGAAVVRVELDTSAVGQTTDPPGGHTNGGGGLCQELSIALSHSNETRNAGQWAFVQLCSRQWFARLRSRASVFKFAIL